MVGCFRWRDGDRRWLLRIDSFVRETTLLPNLSVAIQNFILRQAKYKTPIYQPYVSGENGDRASTLNRILSFRMKTR